MTFSEFLPEVQTWAGENAWIIQVFFVVLFVLFANFIQRRMLRKLHQRLTRTKNPWDDAVVHAAQRPLTWIIWIIGVSFAAQIASTQADVESAFTLIGPTREVAIVACIAWFLVRVIANFQGNIVELSQDSENPIDQTTVDALGKLARASVVITATLVVMQTLGFSISGVLAFGGVGGIAVGFAAKDLLANFFGGLMIYLDRPFSVGDWIRSPDRKIEGTVEKIGWRLTCIRSFKKRPIYVPNSVFANIAVENPSRMSHRRIYETIGIRYIDAERMQPILDAVEHLLRTHEEIDDSQTLMVNFNEFSPSSLDFFIYTFTHTTDWIKFHQIKQDVLLKIEAIIREQGGEIAFPTSTLHVPDAIQLVEQDSQKA